MTHAELLRKHATDATNDGGMWFSGEYMTMLASMAESIEAENAALRTQLADVTESMGRVEERCARLRELCSAQYEFAYDEYPDSAELNFADRMREFGVEAGR